MNFDFVNDEQIKKMLIRDYNELDKCFQQKLSKSVLILAGSILEAVLVDYFVTKVSDSETIQNLYKLPLEKLIAKGNEAKIISDNNMNFSSAIRGYRNLIHPGREMRLMESFDYDTASVSFSALKLILKEVETKTFLGRGRTALEIFQKVSLEGLPDGLFKKIIDKLNKTERTKLFLLLVEDEFKNEEDQLIYNAYNYSMHLIDSMEHKVFVELCVALMIEVESGSKIRALKHIKFLSKRLPQILEPKDFDIVIEFLREEILERIDEVVGVKFLLRHKVFEALFETQNTITNDLDNLAYLSGLISHCYNERKTYEYMDAWTIIHSSLEKETYDKLLEIMGENSSFSQFISDYDNDDYLPF